jgi:hypothetical protein
VATSQQEARWVLRAQCDDREAVEHLLRSIQDSLRRYIAGVVGRPDADDVLQDVLVIVCHKLKSLHTPELFRPWAYRIASRQALVGATISILTNILVVLGLSLFINRMTNKILKAIDLSSKQ